jgi:hypothetical protein
VELYRDPSKMRGEADYFFQSMCGAAEFVRNKLVKKNLTITNETYIRSRGTVIMNDRTRLDTISKILLVPNVGTERGGKSISEWIEKRFRFRDKTLSDLAVSDLSSLIFEYSCLIRTFENFKDLDRQKRNFF